MTIQFKILTEMMLAGKNGNNDINIFYKRTLEDVKNNFEKAKRVYEEEVFPNYVSAYCMYKAKELDVVLDNSSVDKIKQYGSKVIDRIKSHKIEPMPNYNELKEFKI